MPAPILATADFFNPMTGGWTPVAPMAGPRVSPAAAVVTIGGVTGVLVVGGYYNPMSGQTYVGVPEFFDPVANTWTPKATMGAGRWGLGAAPLTFGGVAGVLVAGGYGAQEYSDALFYNPVADSWTTLGPLSTAKYLVGAAPVTIGGVAGVLVTGGYTVTALASAEFFNPVANGWLPVASMMSTHLEGGVSTVALDGGGGVLVAGGSGSNCVLQSNVERFCP